LDYATGVHVVNPNCLLQKQWYEELTACAVRMLRIRMAGN